jgi:hypothetical protein
MKTLTHFASLVLVWFAACGGSPRASTVCCAYSLQTSAARLHCVTGSRLPNGNRSISSLLHSGNEDFSTKHVKVTNQSRLPDYGGHFVATSQINRSSDAFGR